MRLRSAATRIGVVGLVLAGAAVPVAVAGAAVTKPGAPVITSVVPGELTITVAFERPTKTGGSAISDYRATCLPEPGGGKPATKNRPRSPILVTNVSGGKKYRCTVAAKNAAGYGPESSPSAIVVPRKPPPKTLPKPPGHVTAEAAVAAIKVRFDQLRISGGQPVTGFLAKCTAVDGSHRNRQKGTHSPIVVDNLLPAKAYTCQVATRNPSGYSAFSAMSNKVVTKKPPA
jgi:titin